MIHKKQTNLMKPIFLLFLLIFLSITTFAQQPTPAPTPNLYSEKTLTQLKQIQQTALNSDYAYKQTAYLSMNIGARLSGSPQAQRAVEYVESEMKKLSNTC